MGPIIFYVIAQTQSWYCSLYDVDFSLNIVAREVFDLYEGSNCVIDVVVVETSSNIASLL